jgi:hypothetical protein
MRSKAKGSFLHTTITVFMVSVLTYAQAAETKPSENTSQINVIESLLAIDRFDDAREVARNTFLKTKNFAESAAYVSIVAGKPEEALLYLASEQQQHCSALNGKKENIKKSDDYAFVHCSIHWALHARAKFALQDWSMAIESLEMLELVSAPNPIHADLILYALIHKISSQQSKRLDLAISSMIQENPSSSMSRLVQAIRADKELLYLDIADPDELAILLISAAVNAQFLKSNTRALPSILEILKKSFPARLDGINMNIGLLRSLANVKSNR